MLLNPSLLIVSLAARTHISNFWTPSAKVPLMDSYNDAIEHTKRIVQVLTWLEYAWVGTSVLAGVWGY